MSKKTCPLGEDCDLTIAWMKGAEDARDKAKARIEALTEQLEAARLDAKEAEAYSVWLEAKLSQAVEVLGEAWFMLTVPHLDYEPEPEEPGLRRIKTTLAELNGEKR